MIDHITCSANISVPSPINGIDGTISAEVFQDLATVTTGTTTATTPTTSGSSIS
jgi:hypothetical protein